MSETKTRTDPATPGQGTTPGKLVQPDKVHKILTKLRELEFGTLEQFADFLKEENANFTAYELATFGHVLATRLRGAEGLFCVPQWLAETFASLASRYSTKSACDPWAGPGVIAALLSELPGVHSVTAMAITPGECALGKVLVPKAEWKLGHPLQLLQEQTNEFDLVASVLPTGSLYHPGKVGPSERLHPDYNAIKVSGEVVPIHDFLDHTILLAASLRLRQSGVGLFVVSPSLFMANKSLLHRFSDFGIGIEAAFLLPSGTLAPSSNIPAYLVVIRRFVTDRMFVAGLSADTKANAQVFANFSQRLEGGSVHLGRLVEVKSFRGLESLRLSAELKGAEARSGNKVLKLGALMADAGVQLGRPGDDFSFSPHENAIYVPMLGIGMVMESLDALKMKPRNYAQVRIDPSRCNARFVAQFLNSEIGTELREQIQIGVFPKLNIKTFTELPVLVPSLEVQRNILDITARIDAESNTVLALQNELGELRRELWANSASAARVQERIAALSVNMAAGVKQHAEESLTQWFETLPFPLASILRAWQATSKGDPKTKYEHLLHFFEATAAFVSVVLLSAFSTNESTFAPHRRKLLGILESQHLSFDRASFGTWKTVVEYLGKQTRQLLRVDGKTDENNRSLCAEMFVDPSLSLPETLCHPELASIFARTNKYRNDWQGHAGVVGHPLAELRNQQLLSEVEGLRKLFRDTWAQTRLIRGVNCRPRRGVFENEIAVLVGSHSEFVNESCDLAMWLDVDRLYLVRRGCNRALQLLPLVQMEASPQSAKNACYFFSRLEREGARFVSYHYIDEPEIRRDFVETTEAIRRLSAS